MGGRRRKERPAQSKLQTKNDVPEPAILKERTSGSHGKGVAYLQLFYNGPL